MSITVTGNTDPLLYVEEAISNVDFQDEIGVLEVEIPSGENKVIRTEKCYCENPIVKFIFKKYEDSIKIRCRCTFEYIEESIFVIIDKLEDMYNLAVLYIPGATNLSVDTRVGKESAYVELQGEVDDINNDKIVSACLSMASHLSCLFVSPW